MSFRGARVGSRKRRVRSVLIIHLVQEISNRAEPYAEVKLKAKSDCMSSTRYCRRSLCTIGPDYERFEQQTLLQAPYVLLVGGDFVLFGMSSPNWSANVQG